MSLIKKQGKARRLKIVFTEETTEEQLDALILEAEAREEAAAEAERIKKENERKAKEADKKASIVLRNTSLEDVEQKDYFFRDIEKNVVNTAPSYFNKVSGMPVDNEELITVFDGIFPKKKGFLFYKAMGKELYFVIVPLKYATTVGEKNNSIPGDHQRHAKIGRAHV